MLTARKSHLLDYCRKALHGGFAYVGEHQLPSGEFPTYCSEFEDMRAPAYVKSVSLTILVASSLTSLPPALASQRAIRPAIAWLLAEREGDMTWRFFGKESRIVPDLDDVTYALALLKQNNVKLRYGNFARQLLKYRNNEGVFYTWFPEKGEDNNVDWVTNSNVLFLYALLGRRVPEVESYLAEIIRGRRFLCPSHYYHTPYSFVYFFSRLYANGMQVVFKSVVPALREFLCEQGGVHNRLSALEVAMAAVAFQNLGIAGQELDATVSSVLAFQDRDGGWPMASAFRHRTIDRFYGSRELSAAVATEALAKYAAGGSAL